MMSLESGWTRVGRLFQVGVFAAAVASCGDSDTGTGPSSDTTPPSVASTDPAAGASGASRTGSVQVTFSEPIAPATVTGTSFTVTEAGSGVSGTVKASGSVATWTPAADLASGTQYTATLSTAVTDVAGNALASSVTWNFSTNSAPTVATSSQVDATRGTDVTLDASGSTDPDPGQTLTFAWSQVYGTTVTLSGATSAAPTFTAPDEIGTLAFELVVSDGADQVTEGVTVWVLENSESHYWVSPSGSDANAGTRAEPFASIQFALNFARDAGQFGDVYVAAGSYEESLLLRSGVSIYGGFDPVTFLRDVAAHETEINGGQHAVRGSDLSGSTPVTLNGLTIRAADHTSFSEGSSIGLMLFNSPNATVSDNRIIAGAGTDGRNRPTTFSGTAGAAGAFGVNSYSLCSNLAGGAGGYTNVTIRGGNGGNSNLNGAGGQGGAASGSGAGGASGFPGANGQNGQDGATGSSGAPAGDFGHFVSTGFIYVVASGSDGAKGADGGGGGGGGGGGDVFLACGGSGGGGGSGGAGGAGGYGGYGGGGSFGIVVIGTSTNVTIADNDITTGNGGQGGNGGAAGSGGAGGIGRTGGNGTGSSGAGGRGGNGGRGGDGGPGAGGGGGPSVGIAEATTASTNLTPNNLAGNTFTLGTAGSGGMNANPGNPPASAGLRIEYTRR